MMKKTYLAPDMEIVLTATRQPLMAGSIPIHTDEEPITPPGGSDAPFMVTPEDLLGIPKF